MKSIGSDSESTDPIKDYDKLVFLKNFVKATNIFIELFCFYKLLIVFLLGFSTSLLINQAEALEVDAVVEYALNLDLSLTNNLMQQEALDVRIQAFKIVQEGNYGRALEVTLGGIKRFPENFRLQTMLASLLGDYASNFSDPLKTRMLQKSKKIFLKLMSEVEIQSKQDFYGFKNEYYYRFGMYKEQYHLGLKRVEGYWNTDGWILDRGVWGYYNQGVGAANYAKKLLLQGDHIAAFDYAQKAIIAWAQFFSYENSYYNSFVHYAMALGILGHKELMIRVLERAACLIERALNFIEFKEVIDFINSQ